MGFFCGGEGRREETETAAGVTSKAVSKQRTLETSPTAGCRSGRKRLQQRPAEARRLPAAVKASVAEAQTGAGENETAEASW